MQSEIHAPAHHGERRIRRRAGLWPSLEIRHKVRRARHPSSRMKRVTRTLFRAGRIACLPPPRARRGRSGSGRRVPGVEDGGEDERTVEVRIAVPVDGAVARHEGTGPQVPDDPVVLDGGAHMKRGFGAALT